MESRHLGDALVESRVPRDRKVGRAVPGEPPRLGETPRPTSSRTSSHGHSSVSAPFSSACIFASVQRFIFASHTTFVFSFTSSMDTMRKSTVARAAV